MAMQEYSELGIRTSTLMMPHPRVRRVNHSIAQRSNRQAEVDVFVVRRKVVFAEPADGVPRFTPDEERTRRAVVHLTDEPHARRPWPLSSAQAHRRTIPPDDGSGLLDGTIRKQDATANSAHTRIGVGNLHQRLQPSRLDLGVVVEKNEIPSRRSARRDVAAAGKPHVDRRLEDTNTRAGCREQRTHVVVGVVEQNQNLARHCIGQSCQRSQTALETLRSMSRENDNRDRWRSVWDLNDRWRHYWPRRRAVHTRFSAACTNPAFFAHALQRSAIT